mgnify:CR=1 FL=1
MCKRTVLYQLVTTDWARQDLWLCALSRATGPSNYTSLAMAAPKDWSFSEKLLLVGPVRKMPIADIRKRIHLISDDLLRALVVNNVDACYAIADDATKQSVSSRAQKRKEHTESKHKRAFLDAVGSFGDEIDAQITVQICDESDVVNSDGDETSLGSMPESHNKECSKTLIVKQNGIERISASCTWNVNVDIYGRDGACSWNRDDVNIVDSEIMATEEDVPSRSQWIRAAQAFFEKTTPIRFSGESPKKRKRTE